MIESEVRVSTFDGEMTTFTVRPDGDGPFPVGVLFMDGIGYREQIRVNARRFAAGGYYVVAPDLYYRHGDGVTFDFSSLSEPGERERLLKVVGSVSPSQASDDVAAALRAVDDDPTAAGGARVCVGYCMGARLALHASAHSGDEFVAAAGIHPGALVTDRPDSPHLELGSVRGELYFAFAENDPSATAENVERFRSELDRHGVRAVVERLSGTDHGFALADLPVYDAGASERHFERTLDLWQRGLAHAQ